jgi:hypothetical protein
MRWRIGLLQDSAAAERQATKEAAKDAAKKQKQSIPTVKTEAQTKAEEEAAKTAKEDGSEAGKPRHRPKIRPLSEAKAIESGATFISETFLFTVAASLIVFESWRSRRKEGARRDDVADRLNDLEESEKAARKALIELEREVLRLRAKDKGGKASTGVRILPEEIYEVEKDDDKDSRPVGWFARISSWASRGSEEKEAEEALATSKPGKAEQILLEADKALDEKHRKQAMQTVEKARPAGENNPKR